ncbi:MAG: hypothetical protein ACKO3G_09990 [Planctomycetaceae bacterium]
MDSLRRSTGLLPALGPGRGVADWGRGMVMTALASLAASAAVFLAA